MNSNDSRYIKTFENVRKALMNQHHNSVAELLDCSSTRGFLVEINSKDRKYFLKVRIDSDIEYVIFEVYPGITVQEPYTHMFNQYAMKQNDLKKVGNIRLGSCNEVLLHLETSIHDAPLSAESYKNMELLIMKTTFDVEDELDQVAHGIIPAEKKDSKEEFMHLMEEMKKRLSSDDDDDEEDDDDDEMMFADSDEGIDLDDLDDHMAIMNQLGENLADLAKSLGIDLDADDEEDGIIDPEEIEDKEETA